MDIGSIRTIIAITVVSLTAGLSAVRGDDYGPVAQGRRIFETVEGISAFLTGLGYRPAGLEGVSNAMIMAQSEYAARFYSGGFDGKVVQNLPGAPSSPFLVDGNLFDLYLPEATSLANLFADKNTRIRSVRAPMLVSIPDGSGNSAAAFFNCTALESVDMPELTTVGTYAFNGTVSLKKVYLPKARTLSAGAFLGCGVTGTVGSVSFPALESVGQYAFQRSAISEVDSDTVYTVNGYSFANCPSLTRVNLPNLVTGAGYVFDQCNALKEFRADRIATLPSYLLTGCPALETVYLPSADGAIPSIFNGVTSLRNVTLGAITGINSPPSISAHPVDCTLDLPSASISSVSGFPFNWTHPDTVFHGNDGYYLKKVNGVWTRFPEEE